MAIDTLGANALASNSVTEAKIATDAVTSAKIPVNGVTEAKIATDAVTVNKIANDAVTSAKLDTNISIGGPLTSTGKITSTAGITFGSDTAAANVLDDYEEGIHNAVTTTTDDTSTALGITQEDALQYVKIGSMVYIHGSITVGGASSTGAIRVSLPFAPTSLSEKADISYFNITLDSGDGGGGAAQTGQFIGEVNGAVGAEIRVYATDQLSFQSDSAQSMDISCGIGIMGFYYST